MAMALPITKKTEEAFEQYYRQIQDSIGAFRSNLRTRLEKVDKAYQREMDLTEEHVRAKAANYYGDATRFQNITVPVVMPQVEAAVTYQTSVFLTGNPIFGVVSNPQFVNEAMQMETLIDEQAVHGGWTREFILAFRDGFKYNFCGVEVDWKEEVTYSIETTTKNLKEGTTKQISWSGNRVRRLDPYNIILDPRCPPTEVYKRGEFAGFTETMNRIELKSYLESLPMRINMTEALSSAADDAVAMDKNTDSVYVPSINPAVNLADTTPGSFNWMSWANLSSATKGNIDYKETYAVTTLYCRVMPAEFDLRIPERNKAQIFKLIFINHKELVYCERQTNAHSWLPILIGQPLEDGLGYQTKSLAQNAEPFQQVASAYMNSIIHSRRRAITDRVLYDPSRITSAHINSDNPSAKIPVRPAAYGKNVADAVYPFPYREDQAASSMQQIQQLLGLANMLSGQNLASQGQFVKGNKTLHEFESVMQNANGRDQLASILLEAQLFMPLKFILKMNNLQYQGGTTLYNRDKQRVVEIDPVKLREAVIEFKVSDGLIPSSKLMNADTFSVALQVLGSSPQLGAGYNLAPMFSYMMKSQGANISEFEKPPEQQAYEQALSSWQSIATLTIEKGGDPAKLPPQPKPQDYGYNPNTSNPATKPQGQQNQPQPESVING